MGSLIYSMKIARSILFSLALAAAAQAQLGTDSLGFLEQLGSDVKIDTDDTQYDAEKGAIVWSGNVHLELSGTEIFADRAEFDTKLEEIRVTGNVSIYREGVLYRGERATYRVRTQEIDASEMRSAFEPVFFSTDQLDSNLSEISVVNTEGTTFTTDDNPDPDWFIKAKRIEIYPEDRVVFHNPTLYVGDVPILWLPYLSQPLQEDLGYQFTPGYSSQWGAYLLNRYGTLWGDHSVVQFLLDGRTERGLAGGLNLSSQRWRGNPNFGKFQAYYAHDTDPQQSVVSSARKTAAIWTRTATGSISTTASTCPGPRKARSMSTSTSTRSATNIFTRTSFRTTSASIRSRTTSST
jgi:LPS-assembly protein